MKKPSKWQDNVISVEMDANFFFERALRYLDRNNYHKALKYFQRAVDYEPENAVNHCNLAGLLAEMGLFEDSNDILQNVLEELDPTFTEAYYCMASNWVHLDEYELAEEYALRYLEEDTELIYQKEAEEMLAMLSEWLGRPHREIQPQQNIALFQIHDRARFLLEAGRFDESTELLERILQEDPEFLAARNNLALAYYYQEKLDQAMEMVLSVLSVDAGNIHALCNLVVIYEQMGKTAELNGLLKNLKKMIPIQAEQIFKLATTLGIMGEHQTAYQLFQRLIRLGMSDDACICHYTAVAAANSGFLRQAVKWWKQALSLDPCSPVPKFYVKVVEELEPHLLPDTFPYQYNLPYEGKLQELEPQDVKQQLNDKSSWLRPALHWGLHYGDFNLKLQALQALGFVGDRDCKQMLEDFLLQEGESDYLKKVAMFVLRYMSVTGPFEVVLNGEKVWFDPQDEEPVFSYTTQCQAVLTCVTESLDNRFGVAYSTEAKGIWLNFLTNAYPKLPQIRKVGGWGAALEYLTLKKLGEEVTQREVAEIYGVSTGTLSKNVRQIQRHVNS